MKKSKKPLPFKQKRKIVQRKHSWAETGKHAFFVFYASGLGILLSLMRELVLPK